MEQDKAKLFEAAKQISELLSKIPKQDQERVLRWVAESIGLNFFGTGGQQLPLTPSQATPPQQPQLYSPISVTPTPGERPVDIKTFVQSKLPKSDNQFAAVVAYYYRFEAPENQRVETISAEILQDATRQAGRPRIGNPRSTLNNAVTQGYLDRVDTGEYKVNTVGENLVAMTLPSGSDTGTAAKPKKKNKKKAGKSKVKKATKKAKKKAKKKGG